MKKPLFAALLLFYSFFNAVFAQDAVIEVQNKPLHKINKFIYGNFVELLGSSDGGYRSAWDEKKDDFRQDVMQKFKELSIPLLRFPGGCFADTYHWQDGVGDRKKRKTLPNLHWGGIEDNQVGTDEFLQMCKTLHIEPYITVNFGSGTPEEAAAWVEYANKKKKYNVKYWEIGNEIYGGWEKGHTTAYDYAKRYLQFAKAMKKVDKNIKLIAVADSTPFLGQRWNKKLLEIAGDEIDYLDLHFYPPGVASALKGEALYYLVQAQADVVAGIVSQVKKTIDASGKKHVKIAVAEWNVGGVPDALEERLASGIFAGSLLNWFQRMGDFVEIGNFAQLVNTNWSITAVKIGKEKSYATAPYFTLKLYTEHTGENALPVTVKSGTFKVGAAELYYLDAVASMDGKKLYLHVVNRHFKDSITVTLTLGNFSVKKDAAVYVLTADSTDAINAVDAPENIKIKQDVIHNAGGAFTYTFPAHSVTVLELSLEKK